MTGLQKELKKSLKGKKMNNTEETLRTYTGIANILGIAYSTTKRKILKNSFTVTEALTIYNLLYSDEHQEDEFEFFKYLFTE